MTMSMSIPCKMFPGSCKDCWGNCVRCWQSFDEYTLYFNTGRFKFKIDYSVGKHNDAWGLLDLVERCSKLEINDDKVVSADHGSYLGLPEVKDEIFFNK